MKFHIVQVSERIDDISRKYNVAKEEIIKLNRHINNIDSIVPGMKIRLPILSDEVSDQMKGSFLDIEKYYPKVDDFKEVKIEKKNNEEFVDSVEIETNLENIPDKAEINTNLHPIYQQQIYPGYQTYPQQFVPQNYPINQYQQTFYPQYVPQYYMPQQTHQQQFQKYPENNARIKQVPQTNFSHSEMNRFEDSKFFDKPAFCDPVLLEGKSHFKSSTNNIESKLFQKPLFNPPYPSGEEIENDNQFDEDVKEIKIDLRDFVKKHTKIKKKKDSLNLL